jgi:hypothetical protein
MNLQKEDYDFLKKAERQGLIPLNWQEGLDGVTGWPQHYASLMGNAFIIEVNVLQVMDSRGLPKGKFDISIHFKYPTDQGLLCYRTGNHIEDVLDDALLYATWQATLIYNLLSKLETNK